MGDQEPFSKVIRVNLYLLKFSGILRVSVGIISLTEILSVLAFGLLAAFSYSYTKDLIQSDNMDVAMECLAFATVFIGGTIRYMVIAGGRVKLVDMLTACQNLWEFLEIEEKRVVISYVRGAKRFAYFFLSQCMITIFLYAGAPIVFGNGFVRINGNITERILPYSLILKCQDSPCYEVLYTIQILAVINVAMTWSGFDTIGPLFILAASGHMKVLQNRLMSLVSSKEFENFKNDTLVYGSDENNPNLEEHVRKSLGALVNYHQTILKLGKDIEKLMNKAVLLELIMSTYSISALGLSIVGHGSDKSKYVTQMVLSLIQLFLCNWSPDVLLNESEAVAQAAYFMQWYRCTKDVKKSIEIIIMRGQRAVRLTAGNFVYLSLETFATMVSSALSFFTVLSNFN